VGPAVSVVVPTHNRRRLLERLLDALGRQVGITGFQVVVVDDCSTDGTWEALGQRPPAESFELVATRTASNRGPAAARNRGWRLADGSLIAFVDDDCVPEPGWLAALVRSLERADIAQGRTMPIPEQAAGRGPFARLLWIDRDRGLYETCNIGYRRAWLEKLDGFDESFGTVAGAPVWGEDTDLAWRAKEAGAGTAFVPDAVVHCEVYRSDYRAQLREMPRRVGLVRDVARHPGLRRQYPLGLFLSPAHPLAVAAAAGAGTALSGPRSSRRLVLGLGLALPWLWYRLTVRPWPCRRRNLVPVLALGLVSDLSETAVLAAASVRYRTVFL